MAVDASLETKRGVIITHAFHLASSRHQYVLVVVDYATQYLEAVPLWNIRARKVAQELVVIFLQVGFPKQVVTNQGMIFMSKILM